MGATSKTALFVNKQPGGMFSVEDQSMTTGNRWYVDAGKTTTGSDAVGFGRNPEAPYLTLAFAFSGDEVEASNGDIIFLEPGHVESVIAAGTITCDIAGVTVKGLGDKNNRPIISFATIASATIAIDAANITFENITFRCDIADLATAIDVNAAGFTMRNCSFIGTDAADEAFLIAVLTDANANDMTIEDCQFYSLFADDGTAITTVSTECIRLVGADRAKILGNYMSGDYTTSVINSITTGSDDILILGNWLQNIADENITGGIDLHAATTGFMDGNHLYVDDPTDPEDAIDDGACAIGRNWVTNAIGTAPILWGSAGSGGVEGKIDIIDGYHDVPAADAVTDAQMRDVIGKKDDAAQETIGTTRSLVGITKGVSSILLVPAADAVTDVHASDVIGKKDDAAQETVGTTRSLVGITKGLNTILAVPAADAVTDVHISDVVGKKDDAAQETVGTTRSLVGITKGINAILGVPTVDGTDDVHVSDVVGKKDDAGVQVVTTDKSLMGYLKAALDMLNGGTGVATWAAGAAPASGVSIAEGLRYASENVDAVLIDTGTTIPAALGGMVRKTAAFTAGAGTGNIGTFALFTVTGAVKFSIIATCSETVVGAGTLECGVTGTTAGIIAQIADATALITGEIWADATPTLKLDTLANSQLDFVIGDGEDIFLTIGAANLTDGTVDFNIIWIPLNATGNVVAA